MGLEAKSYRAPLEQTFDFPKAEEPDDEDLQESTGFKDVTIRELQKSAEASALSKAGMDGGALMHELVASSLVRATRLDGSVMEISQGDESIDAFMAAIGPKGRTAVGAAYGLVNQPQKKSTERFLKSGRVKVG